MFLSELVEWLFKFCLFFFYLIKNECFVLCVTLRSVVPPSQPLRPSALTSALML